MATIAQQIADLEAAIATGVLIVRHGDRLTQYQTVDDLLKALDYLKKQSTTTAAQTSRYSLANWDHP